MSKKYTIDDMFNDIEKYSQEKEQTNVQRQKEYLRESTMDRSVVKQTRHLDYSDDFYSKHIEPPKIKENSKIFNQGYPIKSYFIKALIATTAIIAFNASHLIFVIFLPLVFLITYISDEENYRFIMGIITVVTINLYMVLFYVPFINYEVITHPLSNIYLNIRTSAYTLSEHKIFIMHQALVLSCIIGIYICIKMFFQNTVTKEKPANIMIVKTIIFYLILFAVGSILIFELLNFLTLLPFMQNNVIVLILILILTNILFFLSNILVRFIDSI